MILDAIAPRYIPPNSIRVSPSNFISSRWATIDGLMADEEKMDVRNVGEGEVSSWILADNA